MKYGLPKEAVLSSISRALTSVRTHAGTSARGSGCRIRSCGGSRNRAEAVCEPMHLPSGHRYGRGSSRWMPHSSRAWRIVCQATVALHVIGMRPTTWTLAGSSSSRRASGGGAHRIKKTPCHRKPTTAGCEHPGHDPNPLALAVRREPCTDAKQLSCWLLISASASAVHRPP